ncbi:hypothetical protein RFI_20520, partial [Reticulomyxa filosa]
VQLKQLIVTTMAEKIDYIHRKEYHKQFIAIDQGHDGAIDWTDIYSFVLKVAPHADDKQVQIAAKAVVENIAGSSDRLISKELWDRASVAKLLCSEQLIAKQFKNIDEDGFLTVQDLTQIFKALSLQQIQQLIDEIDSNDDGQINFEEFKCAMVFQPAYAPWKALYLFFNALVWSNDHLFIDLNRIFFLTIGFCVVVQIKGVYFL